MIHNTDFWLFTLNNRFSKNQKLKRWCCAKNIGIKNPFAFAKNKFIKKNGWRLQQLFQKLLQLFLPETICSTLIFLKDKNQMKKSEICIVNQLVKHFWFFEGCFLSFFWFCVNLGKPITTSPCHGVLEPLIKTCIQRIR